MILKELYVISLKEKEIIRISFEMNGRDESKRQGLNLSGSWQQGHSATYNAPSRI